MFLRLHLTSFADILGLVRIFILGFIVLLRIDPGIQIYFTTKA